MNRKGAVYFDGIKAGVISEVEDHYEFKYDEDYLNGFDSQPISLTIPLDAKTYVSNILFPFFDGLIPEGWLLQIAIDKLGLKVNDRMTLLLNLCEDTIGAVSIKEISTNE